MIRYPPFQSKTQTDSEDLLKNWFPDDASVVMTVSRSMDMNTILMIIESYK